VTAKILDDVCACFAVTTLWSCNLLIVAPLRRYHADIEWGADGEAEAKAWHKSFGSFFQAVAPFTPRNRYAIYEESPQGSPLRWTPELLKLNDSFVECRREVISALQVCFSDCSKQPCCGSGSDFVMLQASGRPAHICTVCQSAMQKFSPFKNIQIFWWINSKNIQIFWWINSKKIQIFWWINSKKIQIFWWINSKKIQIFSEGFISCAGRHRHPRCYEGPQEAHGRDTAGSRP
jgi:hypothetical protein